MRIEPGVYTALVTLMKGDEADESNPIDYERTQELIDHQKAAGAKSIVLLGTTGQSPTVIDTDRKEFIRRFLPYVRRQGMIPVIGCGINNTRVAREESEFVSDIDPEAPLLHVTGQYNKPGQKGLLAHFGKVATAVPNPIILYNVPGRTANYIAPETVIELARTYPNIVGLKQAVDFSESAQIANKEAIEKGKVPDYRADTKRILKEAPEGFSVFSGEDNLVAEGMGMGFRGVISASANIRPHPFVEIVKAGLEGRMDEAMRIQLEVNPVVAAVFKRTNPVPLHLMFGSHLRLPMSLEDITAADRVAIQQVLDACPSPDAYFNRKVA